MDFLTLLQQYMDGYAMIVGIGISQLLIHFFPKLGESKTIGNRLMPLVPIVAGVATTLVHDYWFTATPGLLGDLVIKGIVSGFAAVYISRTFKVSILGV